MTVATTLDLLPEVQTIARQAGQILLRYYIDSPASLPLPEDKPRGDAGHASEAVIIPALHHLAPDVPVVWEEAFCTGRVPADPGRRFWLVEPLDGARAFLDRSGDFAVAIALVENGRPVLGVIHAPASGDLYAAAGPASAVHRSDGHGPQRIVARPAPAAGLTVITDTAPADPQALDRYLAGLPVRERRRRGSILKLCDIACGGADLYPHLGPSSEWATAAGQAVLEAAGGRIERMDGGGPLTYGKPDFLNPPFVAHGRK